MKKQLSAGTIAAVLGGIVAVVGLFYLFQWFGGGSGQTADDRAIEKQQIQQAKSEYWRYEGKGPSGEPAPGGPPASGEGAAQAAAPGGVAGGG